MQTTQCLGTGRSRDWKEEAEDWDKRERIDSDVDPAVFSWDRKQCAPTSRQETQELLKCEKQDTRGDVLVNPVACLMIGGRSPHSLRFPFPCPPSNGSARPLPTTALPAPPSIAHRTAPIPPLSKQRYEARSRRFLHPRVLLRPSLVDIAGSVVHPLLILDAVDSSHLAVLATIAALRQRRSNGLKRRILIRFSSIHPFIYTSELVNCS